MVYLTLTTLEVLIPLNSVYCLVPEFHYLITAMEKTRKVTSEDDLLKKLERQREIGLVGEMWVTQYEQNRIGKEYPGYHYKVERVSENNVALGYDVYSRVSPLMEERFIEVKTTAAGDIHFFLTANELEVCTELGERYWIYILVGMHKDSRPEWLYCIQNPNQFFSTHNIGSLPTLFEFSIPKGECWEMRVKI